MADENTNNGAESAAKTEAREAADKKREAEAKARGEEVKSEAAKNRSSKIAALERELGGKTAGDKALDAALFVPSVVAGVVAKPFVMAVNAGNMGINAVERTVAFGAGLVSGVVSAASSVVGGISGFVESVSKTVQVAFLKGADVLERNGWGVAAKLSEGLSKVPEVIGKAAGYGTTASEFGDYVSSKIEGVEKGLTAKADANVEKRNARSNIASKLVHGKAREAYRAYKGEISEDGTFVEQEIDLEELERRKKAAALDAANPIKRMKEQAADGQAATFDNGDPKYVETRRNASKEEIKAIEDFIAANKDKFSGVNVVVDKGTMKITGLSKEACFALDKMYEENGITTPVDLTKGQEIKKYIEAEKAKEAKEAAQTPKPPVINQTQVLDEVVATAQQPPADTPALEGKGDKRNVEVLSAFAALSANTEQSIEGIRNKEVLAAIAATSVIPEVEARGNNTAAVDEKRIEREGKEAGAPEVNQAKKGEEGRKRLGRTEAEIQKGVKDAIEVAKKAGLSDDQALEVAYKIEAYDRDISAKRDRGEGPELSAEEQERKRQFIEKPGKVKTDRALLFDLITDAERRKEVLKELISDREFNLEFGGSREDAREALEALKNRGDGTPPTQDSSPAKEAAGMVGVELSAGNTYSDLPLSKTETTPATAAPAQTAVGVEVANDKEFWAAAKDWGVVMTDSGVGDRSGKGGDGSPSVQTQAVPNANPRPTVAELGN